jgi:hypothetical protein
MPPWRQMTSGRVTPARSAVDSGQARGHGGCSPSPGRFFATGLRRYRARPLSVPGYLYSVSIRRRMGCATARCFRLSRDRSRNDQVSRFLSTRHFAPARHLASCLSWKPGLTYADRRWLALVVSVALLRSAPRADYHPVVGEEIARWAIWHDACQLSTLR